MSARHFSFLVLTTMLCLCSSCTTDILQPNENLSEDELVQLAQDIHERVITLDTHCDFRTSNFTEEVNYTQDLPTQVNLPKMEAGGLDVPWLIVYTGQGDLDEEGYEGAMENAMDKFNAINRLCEEYAPDKIALATSSEDVRRIIDDGKMVAMIGIENGYPVGTDVSNVKKFYDLGGRYMSLSHNGHSQLCDSNTGERDSVWLHNGVSPLGREVIKEMNKWGMMIDVSHPSKKSMLDMIELSVAPIIASHSSARALCDHSRNLDDEQLDLMAQNGGVVQAVAFGSYLNTEKNRAFTSQRDEVYAAVAEVEDFEILPRSEIRRMDAEERAAYSEGMDRIRELAAGQIEEMKKEYPPVGVDDLVDHIDYMVDRMGIRHAGISSDFDGGGGIEGWRDASETFNVTLELVKRGYSEEDIGMLWSGNLLRVLDEVTEIAKSIQAESVLRSQN